MKKNGGECVMGNGAIKPEELNGQAVKETDRNYFVHGNVRIIINEHFGLGMWIRNNWIYLPDDVDPVTSDRYKKCYVMLSGEPGSNCQCWHADELSGGFLGKYYDHLKATYCDEPFSNETK